MDENMERTPHPQDPAEGAPGVDVPEEDNGGQGGAQGGAIQGDSSQGDSPRGAIQGDAGPDRDAPLGGDERTASQLDADNDIEENTLQSLDPDNPPA